MLLQALPVSGLPPTPGGRASWPPTGISSPYPSRRQVRGEEGCSTRQLVGAAEAEDSPEVGWGAAWWRAKRWELARGCVPEPCLPTSLLCWAPQGSHGGQGEAGHPCEPGVGGEGQRDPLGPRLQG